MALFEPKHVASIVFQLSRFKICALQGCYAYQELLAFFMEGGIDTLSRNVGKELPPILKMVRYYHHTLRDIRKERTSHVVRGKSLNARPRFVFDSYLLVISNKKAQRTEMH